MARDLASEADYVDHIQQRLNMLGPGDDPKEPVVVMRSPMQSLSREVERKLGHARALARRFEEDRLGPVLAVASTATILVMSQLGSISAEHIGTAALLPLLGWVAVVVLER